MDPPAAHSSEKAAWKAWKLQHPRYKELVRQSNQWYAKRTDKLNSSTWERAAYLTTAQCTKCCTAQTHTVIVLQKRASSRHLKFTTCTNCVAILHPTQVNYLVHDQQGEHHYRIAPFAYHHSATPCRHCNTSLHQVVNLHNPAAPEQGWRIENCTNCPAPTARCLKHKPNPVWLTPEGQAIEHARLAHCRQRTNAGNCTENLSS